MSQASIAELKSNQIVRKLTKILGCKITAYIGSFKNTEAIHDIENNFQIEPNMLERLRVALQVAEIIKKNEENTIVQAWFCGMNPELDDRNPAQLIREGNLTINGPEVLAAATFYYYNS